MSIRKRTGLLLAGALICLPVLVLYGQQNDSKQAASTKKEGKAPASKKKKNGLSLNQKQNLVSDKYRRFERTMRQVTEYLRKNNPEQANLLVRATSAGVSHHEDRVEARLHRLFAGLRIDDLFGADRVHQVAGNLVGSLRPNVDDLVVSLAVGDSKLVGSTDRRKPSAFSGNLIPNGGR